MSGMFGWQYSFKKTTKSAFNSSWNTEMKVLFLRFVPCFDERYGYWYIRVGCKKWSFIVDDQNTGEIRFFVTAERYPIVKSNEYEGQTVKKKKKEVVKVCFVTQVNYRLDETLWRGWRSNFRNIRIHGIMWCHFHFLRHKNFSMLRWRVLQWEDSFFVHW